MMRFKVCTSLLLLSYSLGCFAQFESNVPLDFHDQPASPQLQSIQLLQAIPQDKLTTYQLPQIQSLDVDPNVRTLFVGVNDLPIVDLQLTFNGGSARDESIEPQLYGLANTTARLLDNGQASVSHKMHLQSLQSLGAQYSVNAYRDMFTIKLRMLSDPHIIQKALYHLNGLLKPADFPQSNINKLWLNSQVGQKQVLQNPTSSMNVRFYRVVYQQHAYAEPVTGTNQSLRKIKSAHLQAFQNKYLVKNNLNLAITGDISIDQAKEISSYILSNLPQGNKATPIVLADQPTQAKFIYLPFNSDQAYVQIGQLGIARNHPDRIALEVGNHLLGASGFNSLLMKSLREKNGFTYSASSQLSSLQAQGLFSINYSTQRNNLLASLKIAYQTLFDFIYQPLDESIVEETKQSILNAFPKQFASNANINAQLGLIGFYELPNDYIEQYLFKVKELKAIDIQRAWQQHLKPQQLITLVAGQNIDLAEIKKTYIHELKALNE